MRPTALGSVAIGVGFAIALTASLWPTSTTFRVSATTESIELVAGAAPPFRWLLRDVAIHPGRGREPVEFSGMFSPYPGTLISLERIGTGALRIRMKSASGQSSVGALFDASDEPSSILLGEHAQLEISDLAQRSHDGRPVRFPIVGEIDAGGPYASGSARLSSSRPLPLLTSGDVAMIGSAAVTERPYDAGHRALGLGDRFEVVDPEGPAVGIISIDGEPGMTTTYRVRGSTGRVSRLGSEGYDLRSTLLVAYQRLTNDPLVLAMWALVTLPLTIGRRWFAKYLFDSDPSSRSDCQPKRVPESGPKDVVATSALLIVSLVMANGVTGVANATDVFVQGLQHGAGVTRAHPGGCFVVTPRHVVDDSDEIEIISARRRAGAQIEKLGERDDIALLRVEESGGSLCEGEWEDGRSLRTLLNKPATFELRSALANGDTQLRPVRLVRVNDRYLYVAPTDSKTKLAQGMSGSRLLIGEHTAGMLLSVEGKQADWRVLRQDHLHDILRAFFVEAGRPPTGSTACIAAGSEYKFLVRTLERKFEKAGLRTRDEGAGRCDLKVGLTGTVERNRLSDGGHQVVAYLELETEREGAEPHRSDLELRGYAASGFDVAFRATADKFEGEIDDQGLWKLLGFE